MANKFVFNALTGQFDLVNEGASVTVSDTNSIDLTKAGIDISADLKISAVAPDVNFKQINLDVQVDGLRAQVSNENIQDAVGTILTDTASIDLVYDDAGNQITATVLPAGVDHNALQNYVADEHVAHSTIDVNAGVGLSGGGNIASDVTINLDIPELTDEPTIADNDYIAIYDTTAAAHRKITKENLTKDIPASQITNTPSGTISAINVQDAIDELDTEKIPYTEKGVANGVASLDGGGKVPIAQLPSSIMEYKGVWNAATNTPTLADGVGDIGDVYRVGTAGTQDLGSGPISFEVGDYVIYNGTIWEKSDTTDAVASVNGLVGIVVLDTDDINEGATNLYFNNERAQDAVGAILTDTSSIDFTYNDGANTIVADVIPAGVDHDALLNYVANEHIDHSVVQIATGSNSGLSGGGDITTTRNLSVDINGTTAETVPANNDEILIYDQSATALRKMSRANFLSGFAVASPYDINQTNFVGANNVVAPTDITLFNFPNANVRSFNAEVNVLVDADSDLYEKFTLDAIQRDSDWTMTQETAGDNSGVNFSITSTGQLQYTSSNYTGFVSLNIKFKAKVIEV